MQRIIHDRHGAGRPLRILPVVTLALASFAGLVAPAHAGEDPSYEDARLARALGEGGYTVVADPQGRPIRKIHIIRHDVLAEDELFPTFFNIFHALTRTGVIRRELLFAVGDRWQQPRADESMRNLRALGIFTIVRVVGVVPHDPAAGLAAPAMPAGDPVVPPNGPTPVAPCAPPPAAPDHAPPVAPDAPPARDAAPPPAAGDDAIDVVVFTRDLWSIRVETTFQVTDGFLDQLAINLIERNLAGEGKQAALRFELLPRTFSLGETFYDPRLLGGALALDQTFDVVFNRASGAPEGSRGTLALGIPLRDLHQAWGFDARVGYDDTIGRQLSGRQLLTYDVPETVATEAIPRVWDQHIVSASVQLRYQTGDSVKSRIAGGFGGSDLALAPRGDLTREEAAAFRRDVLPPTRRQLYPFVTWTGFTPDYTTFVDLASYGLTEDVRLGPWWVAQLAFPLEAFGSSDDALSWALSAGFVAAPGGGLVDLQAELAGRLEQSRVIDQRYNLRLRGATPPLGFGRLVASAYYEGRVHDSGQTLVTLGGDNGLRGYASQTFYGYGASRLRLNAEWRTPPWVIASAHLGGIVFWDGGAVWDGVSRFALRQSVGLGVRLLFPQFNRFTFRIDLGVPLDGDGFTVLATFGSLQAVPLTAAEDTTLSQ